MTEQTDENKDITEMLKQLTSLFGVSSDEKSVSEYIAACCKPLADEIYTDKFGNTILKIFAPDKSAKTLILEAHTDRVGFIVSKILDDGRIKFSALGGIDDRTLLFSDVIFESKAAFYIREPEKKVLCGIIMPDKKVDDKAKPITLNEMSIFTGYSKDELKQRVSIGDKAIINSGFTELLDGSVCSGAMDNRVGIAAILLMLKRLNHSKLKYNLTVIFSSEEELGLHGGYTGTIGVDADAAIVIDVTHGMTPDSENQSGVFKLGCGAVICRGPNLDYVCTKRLIELAKSHDIPYEIEVAPTHSGTTAWAIQTANGGTPVMLVSIADKYMHTNVETVLPTDVIAVSRLLCTAAEEGIGLE